MNLNKHDSQTSMEMDMTPMIDVVFLLIIFFMIITDLSQKDLEELQLPVAVHADEDKPKPGELRPVLNITQDGRIIHSGQVVYDPEDPDDYKGVKAFLADTAKRMKTDFFDSEAKTGPQIPDEALLIRADQFTAFKEVQKIMSACGLKDIQIWKVQLAVKEPNEANKPKSEEL